MERSSDLTGTIGTLTRVEESNGITKPRILIIYTGGTIGMTENPVTGRLEPYNFANLIENVPKLRRLDFNIDYYQFDVPVDSSAINPNHWVTMAHIIEDTYDQYDGYVVLHGTDTMAYTASALSFMLQNLYRIDDELHAGESAQAGGDNRQPAPDRGGADRRRGKPDHFAAGGSRADSRGRTDDTGSVHSI